MHGRGSKVGPCFNVLIASADRVGCFIFGGDDIHTIVIHSPHDSIQITVAIHVKARRVCEAPLVRLLKSDGPVESAGELPRASCLA